MGIIHVLSKSTVELIAAGEVVERPFNVVKELTENSIDAHSSAVTVEIKDGGLKLIRVSDNGVGISKDDIRTAFLPHATSKINDAEDLKKITSLGFRGEALSSIAAVSSCEVISKTESELTGVRYMTEGSEEQLFEEVGAPNGTTIIVRELFYNVPARRKFLKAPQTEGAHIGDLVEHLALSHPEIAIKFITNGRTVFATAGMGDLKDVIYRIYGKDITDKLIRVKTETPEIEIDGYIAKPEINRGNRNSECFFINGRYVYCDEIRAAVEEGYRGFLMLHKFPFTVLHFRVEPEKLDVNVHPAKLSARLTNAEAVYEIIKDAVADALSGKELIPDTGIGKPEKEPDTERIKAPEPFEFNRIKLEKEAEEDSDTFSQAALIEQEDKNAAYKNSELYKAYASRIYDIAAGKDVPELSPAGQSVKSAVIKKEIQVETKNASQLNMFEEEFLTAAAREHYEILGQVFKTYWLIAYSDKLFIMDQHAAHEKVNYERLLKAYKNKTVASQYIDPPVVIELSTKEAGIINEYMDTFRALGFEIEDFGLNSVAIRQMPTDLYGCDERTFFREVLDELIADPLKGDFEVCLNKLASMSCKAAVKGNNVLSYEEVGALLDELLTLDNPYNCPHGRPTIISMSKYEMDRKFKRIVT